MDGRERPDVVDQYVDGAEFGLDGVEDVVHVRWLGDVALHDCRIACAALFGPPGNSRRGVVTRVVVDRRLRAAVGHRKQ